MPNIHRTQKSGEPVMEQQATQILGMRELRCMRVGDLEVYKVKMSLAAMSAPNELLREQYRNAMNQANIAINNKQRRL